MRRGTAPVQRMHEITDAGKHLHEITEAGKRLHKITDAGKRVCAVTNAGKLLREINTGYVSSKKGNLLFRPGEPQGCVARYMGSPRIRGVRSGKMMKEESRGKEKGWNGRREGRRRDRMEEGKEAEGKKRDGK